MRFLIERHSFCITIVNSNKKVNMWPFKKKLKIEKSPHEIFPGIMHWKINDRMSDPSVSDKLGHSFWFYDGVNEKGDVFFSDRSSTTIKVNINKIHRWFNLSLYKRGMNQEKQSTKEYMQLMKDFQQAYKEISI